MVINVCRHQICGFAPLRDVDALPIPLSHRRASLPRDSERPYFGLQCLQLIHEIAQGHGALTLPSELYQERRYVGGQPREQGDSEEHQKYGYAAPLGGDGDSIAVAHRRYGRRRPP